MLDKKAIDQLWFEQDEKYLQLQKLAIEKPDNWQSVFHLIPKRIVCMDERVQLREYREPIIGLAGSGILLSDKQRQRFVDKLAQEVDPGTITVTYHEYCGACNLYCFDHPDQQPLPVAKKSAEELRKMLGTNKPLEKIGWSDDCQIKAAGKTDFHHARVIFVDGTGKFNPGRLKLIDGFLLSVRYYPDDAYIMKEISIAISLCFGNHGFGQERFHQYPLLIALIGDETNEQYENRHLSYLVKQSIKDHSLETIKVIDLA